MASFVDTNILIYAKLTEQPDDRKRILASDILRRPDCVFSVQVMQEFYVQATRVSRPGSISHEMAVGLILAWSRFRIQNLTFDVLSRAFELKDRYRFSYWDCAIVAAALSARCDTLFTEDMHHGQVIEGLKIVNPFKDE